MTRAIVVVAVIAALLTVALDAHASVTPAQHRAAGAMGTALYRVWNDRSPIPADKVRCTAYTLTRFLCEVRVPTMPGALHCLEIVIHSDGAQDKHWWHLCRGAFAEVPVA